MKAHRTSGVLICCTVGLVLVARTSEAQNKPTRTCDVGAYLISLRIRHVLTVVVENTNAPASKFSYTPDTAGSKPSRDIAR